MNSATGTHQNDSHRLVKRTLLFMPVQSFMPLFYKQYGCLWLTFLFVGCGGYNQTISSARNALQQGHAQRSVKKINQVLKDAPKEHLPLLHLERAIARHQLGDLQEASKDYQYADDALEILDYTSATAQEIASYLYSDDTAPYRPPAYEKSLINLLNLMSYLERGDVNGARVEAKRFRVYTDYFQDQVRQGNASNIALEPLLALGATLGVYTALATGDFDQAIRWAQGNSSLLERIEQERVRLEQDEPVPQTHLLILSSQGLIVQKRPVRLGLGTAMLYLSSHPDHGMSAEEHQRFQRTALNASVKWVNFVKLVSTRPLMVDEGQVLGIPAGTSPLVKVNLSALARFEFERNQAKMMAAAISRLLTRAIAGAGTKEVAKRQIGPLGGLLLGLAVEGTMSAADTPDTRAWSVLPEELSLYWLTLPPGQYRFSSVALRSAQVPISLKTGEFKAISLPRRLSP